MDEKSAGLVGQAALVGKTINTVIGGNRLAAVGEAMAGGYRQKAKTERALAGHRARDKRRAGRYLASKGQARAAAGGAGAGDPTVVNIIGDIKGEAEYRALMDLFMGDEAANMLNYRAEIAEWEGDQAQSAATTAAGIGLASGLAKYGEQEKKPSPIVQPVRMSSPPRTTKKFKF